ncbi:MAG: flagellar motor switch protein FliM [Alphaproteobacteria bacterium]|nr:flagellar motor switch protein FliM [Alphaproteobacteria bacterium]
MSTEPQGAEGGSDAADAERLAAEWAAMAAAGTGGGEGEGGAAAGEEGFAAAGEGGEGYGAGAPEPTRVLNQAEIDSLMGFEGGENGAQDVSGIDRLVSAGLVSYERLPMLEVVFDRLVRILSTSLRNLTSDNVEVSLDNIASLRFGDYLNSIPLPAMLAVFRAEEWDNHGLLMVDSAMIYSIVDVLLGGRRGTAPMRVDGRPYTTIERNLVQRLVEQVLSDLSAAFAPLCPARFTFDRLEVNPRFAAVSRDSNACIVVKLRIEMDDRGGRLDLLIPYATLEPVRELLLQQFMGEKFGRDSIWENHLAEELWQTEVALEAVLDEQAMRLGDVMAFEPGRQLVLNIGRDAPVRLRCGGIDLFLGRVGRRQGRVAVRVDKVLKQYGG